MMLEVSFTISSLFEDCIAQNAVDFKALRMRQPDAADAVYADFSLSADVHPEFQKALSLALAEFNAQFPDKIASFNCGTEVATWELSVENGAYMDSVGALFFAYFKYTLLAWWYIGRDENLQVHYNLRAADVRTSISKYFSNAFGGRKLRHW